MTLLSIVLILAAVALVLFLFRFFLALGVVALMAVCYVIIAVIDFGQYACRKLGLGRYHLMQF